MLGLSDCKSAIIECFVVSGCHCKPAFPRPSAIVLCALARRRCSNNLLYTDTGMLVVLRLVPMDVGP